MVAIGIVAGNGDLPLECAKNIRSSGRKVVVAAHTGETDRAIKKFADDCLWVKIGELQKILDYFRSAGVREVIFAGGIRRISLFFTFRPDARTRQMLSKQKSLKDDSVLRGIAGEFEESGIKVLPFINFLDQKDKPVSGVITKRTLSIEERNDALVGWQAAQAIGAADIGQTIVANKGTVVAVEAVEGTDATILRAGKISGKGSVVVKRCKSTQDLRFDLPTVGPKTIKTMKKARSGVLLLETPNSVILSRDEVIKLANQFRICILLCKEESDIR